ncbi:GPR1/FUN34/yaaH family-domain-containing protein [Exophiala viscosa]|uniref:GPR1/FUN34/yaaH family-domain-containing protein n=1 Tax=Exophiala viscosa TaxID=2486360 RepID=A0AAN6DPE5_9EURO|nr:GPR1/FUN34/yaaH family-domain-containing protein [Exophiala viscosa]
MSPRPDRSTPCANDFIKSEPPLAHAMSSSAISMSAEVFEKLYMTPETPRVGDNLRRFANPTPLGFMGFVIAAITFSMVLLGFGGASGLSPVVGIFFFTGPLLLLLATIFEWIMGNFFPMMAFGALTVFWLSFGLLQLPTLGLATPYDSAAGAADGALSKEYNAAIALYLLVWGFALFTFLILSTKTNLGLASIFVTVTTGAFLLSGAYWKLSTGAYATAKILQKAGGGMILVTGFLSWYMTVVMMAAEMQFPIRLPVGDLNHFWDKAEPRTGEEV